MCDKVNSWEHSVRRHLTACDEFRIIALRKLSEAGQHDWPAEVTARWRHRLAETRIRIDTLQNIIDHVHDVREAGTELVPARF